MKDNIILILLLSFMIGILFVTGVMHLKYMKSIDQTLKKMLIQQGDPL